MQNLSHNGVVMIQKVVHLFVILALFVGCGPKVVYDQPELLNDSLVRFNVALQGKDYPRALELIVKEERDILMDNEGEVKEEFLLGMRRLRISTLKQKNIQVNTDGRLIGMLAVIMESSRFSQISKEQRKLTTIDPPSSSSVLIPSSSSAYSSSSQIEMNGFEMPNDENIVSEEFIPLDSIRAKKTNPPVIKEDEFVTPEESSSSLAVPLNESNFVAPDESSSSLVVPLNESNFVAPENSSDPLENEFD